MTVRRLDVSLWRVSFTIECLGGCNGSAADGNCVVALDNFQLAGNFRESSRRIYFGDKDDCTLFQEHWSARAGSDGDESIPTRRCLLIRSPCKNHVSARRLEWQNAC